jgi:hypothetical protein
LRETRYPRHGDITVWLDGTPVIERGDRLLFVGQERLDDPTSDSWNVRRVRALSSDARNNRTRITLDAALSNPPEQSRVYVFRQRASIFGYNAPDWMGLPKETKLAYLGLDETATVPSEYRTQWPQFSIFSPKFPEEIINTTFNEPEPAFEGGLVLRSPAARASGDPFDEIIASPRPVDTGRPILRLTTDTVDLDQSFPKIAEGSWLLLTLPGELELFSAVEVSESSRADYLLSSKTTRVRLSGDLVDLDGTFEGEVRRTAVFAQSEELPLAQSPILDPVRLDETVLDSIVDSLPAGREAIVSGRPARLVRIAAGPLTLTTQDGTASRTLQAGTLLYAAAEPEEAPGSFEQQQWMLMTDDGFIGLVTADADAIEYVNTSADDAETLSELVEIKAVESADESHSKLLFTTSLVNVYQRESVTIAANVARATHGETVIELLGGGDAAQAFQKFRLKQTPLTYLTGGVSTLAVRVNDVLWTEVPSLYGRGPVERIYTTEHDDDGYSTVVFGDGVQGARLPTGLNNVRATYRKGSGLGGMVAAGQLTQLMTRPLGVKEAVNPLAPEGAQDSETLDQARRNAPLKILTLDRVVSLQDYEDYARSYGGIEKALATWTWTGERNQVLVTVAGAGGSTLSETGDTVTGLLSKLREIGDPRVPIVVKPYTPVSFHVVAGLYIDPAYEPDVITAAAEQALRDKFSFSARDFGQPVALSEVAAALHEVEGIVGVDVDALYREGDADEPNSLLFAFTPRPGGVDIIPAELLTLSSDPVSLEVRA